MSGKLIQQVVEAAAPGHVLKYDTCVVYYIYVPIGSVVMVGIQSLGLPIFHHFLQLKTSIFYLSRNCQSL